METKKILSPTGRLPVHEIILKPPQKNFLKFLKKYMSFKVLFTQTYYKACYNKRLG